MERGMARKTFEGVGEQSRDYHRIIESVGGGEVMEGMIWALFV